jgi:hypothetical protein
MATKKDNNQMSLPLCGMYTLGVSGAVVVAASFAIINHWPLPVAIAPYYGFDAGAAWGFVVGGLAGLCVGYIADEKHFSN